MGCSPWQFVAWPVVPLQVLMAIVGSVRRLGMYIGCFGMCILSLWMYILSLRTEPTHPFGSVHIGIGLNSAGGTDCWGICFVFHYQNVWRTASVRRWHAGNAGRLGAESKKNGRNDIR